MEIDEQMIEKKTKNSFKKQSISKDSAKRINQNPEIAILFQIGKILFYIRNFVESSS